MRTRLVVVYLLIGSAAIYVNYHVEYFTAIYHKPSDITISHKNAEKYRYGYNNLGERVPGISSVGFGDKTIAKGDKKEVQKPEISRIACTQSSASENQSAPTNCTMVTQQTSIESDKGEHNGSDHAGLLKNTRAAPRGHYGTSDRSIDCHKLASGDKAEMKQAEEFAREYKYKPLLPSDYLSLTANCTSFRLKSGYSAVRTDDDEKSFPLAFTIRMHESVEQAERLLRAIYRPHNVYCIHIDRKSPSSVHTAMAAIVSCLPNVHLALRFIDYGYGTYSPVEADLICMKDLIRSPVQWKYLLNMAGTEFPLKTNKEIVTILKYLNGTNDVEQYPFFEWLRHRFQYQWERYGDYIRKTNITKSPFSSITLLKGCSYNSLSRRFVKWVLSDDEVVVRFLQWLQDTAAPDETVWASLNNHPRAPGGYPVMVTQTSKTFLSREVIWQWDSAYCQSKLRHQICLLSFHELPWLNQRWELFANKFDLGVDHVGYGCLEQLLQERTRLGQVQIPWYGIDRATHVYFTRVLHRNVTQAAKEGLLTT